MTVDLPLFRHLLVVNVKLLELTTEGVVQGGNLVRAEQGPGGARFHALHEQVRDPVRRVHVVGATAVVPGVLPQL